MHIDVQGSSEAPQSHCRNPILAALVFLNLLQPHATSQADHRLRQAELTPPPANAFAEMLINVFHALSAPAIDRSAPLDFIAAPICAPLPAVFTYH